MNNSEKRIIKITRKAIIHPSLLSVLLCIGLFSSSFSCFSAQEKTANSVYLGRSLTDVLSELNQQGYKIFYSSSLVHAGMVIKKQPKAREGAKLIKELLTPFALTLKTDINQVYIVVKATKVSTKLPTTVASKKTSRNPPAIEKIVISASQYDIAYAQTEQQQFMDQQEIERLSHLANDVVRAITILPGVAGGDASAQPHIRGGNADENLYLFDGMPLFEPFHLKDGGSLFSVIDSFTVAGAQIITGGAPVEFGDHLSGVIQLSSASYDEELPVSFGLNFLDVKAKMGGSWGDKNNEWFLSLRRGDISTVSATSDIEGKYYKPNYLDIFAKINFDLSNDSRLTWHSLVSQDSNICLYQCFNHRKSESVNSYHWLTLTNQWNSQLSSKTLLGYGNFAKNRNGVANGAIDGDDSAFANVDDQLNWHFYLVKQAWKLQLSSTQILNVGGKFQFTSARYNYRYNAQIYDPFLALTKQPGVRISQYDLTPKGEKYSFYVSDLFKINKAMTIETGVRWDHQNYTHEQFWSPRVNLDYLAQNGGNYKFSWGVYQQNQGIEQLPLQDNITDFHSAQQVKQLNFSYQQQLTKKYTFKISLYDKNYQDIAPRFENLLGSESLIFERDFTRQILAPQSAKAQGLELLLQQHQNSKLSWWLSYTLSAAHDNINGKVIPRRWQQRHALTFSANYQFNESCNFNVLANYHSGWRTTAVQLEQSSALDNVEQAFYLLDEPYGKEFPYFFRVDARLGCESNLGGNHFRYFVEALNIFNRKNVSGGSEVDKIFADNGAVIGLQLDGKSYVPFVPSIGFVWSF